MQSLVGSDSGLNYNLGISRWCSPTELGGQGKPLPLCPWQHWHTTCAIRCAMFSLSDTPWTFSVSMTASLFTQHTLTEYQLWGRHFTEPQDAVMKRQSLSLGSLQPVSGHRNQAHNYNNPLLISLFWGQFRVTEALQRRFRALLPLHPVSPWL